MHNKINSLLLKHIIFTLSLTFVLLLPDIVYYLLEDGFIVVAKKIWREIIGLIVVVSLILALPSQKSKRIVFVFFTLLSLVELIHFAFFHGLLTHYEIMFFFTQFSEVRESLASVIQYMSTPLILWSIQMVIGFWLLHKSNHRVVTVKYIGILLIIPLLVLPYSVYKRSNISIMRPTSGSISIVNMLNSVSLFIGKEVPKYFLKEKAIKVFKPYKIEKADVKLPQNIIMVMGESLGYKHMHLFGAKPNNTPHLDQLKYDKNFIYRKGYSSGVDTLTAVPTFFLLKREPENIALIGKSNTNLLSLAKKNKYHVYYLTTQKLNIMAPYVGDAETVKAVIGKDENLVKALSEIDFTEKNFIILHQRNSHSPYEESTPERFYKYPFKNMEFHTHMLHSYYNAILYTDYIISAVVDEIKKHPNSVMFMVPDHAEMMGLPEENGRYGHSFLDKEASKIPIFIYINNVDRELIEIYKRQKCYNHYTLGKLVANTLGYSIDNPNDDGQYYIQGTSIDGSNGFIEYDTQECSDLNGKE